MRSYFARQIVAVGICFAASAVMLTVMHPPYGIDVAAWVAWVPVLLACSAQRPAWLMALVAYGVAVGFWLFNLFWLAGVTLPGYVAFAFWQALYWPAIALLLRFGRQKNVPLVLLAALVIVGAEAVQGFIFGGFGWFFLAHSQYQRLALIQIADIGGALAVSALVAAVNGLVAEAIVDFSRQKTLPRRFWLPLGITAALLAGAVGYGKFRLAESRHTIANGPLIAAVQPNVPSLVKEQIENAEEIFHTMSGMSEEAFHAGAVMVAWPETMVLAYMNPEYMQYCPLESRSVRFASQIAQLARYYNGYVLFGANAAHLEPNLAISDMFNSAFLYRPDGSAAPQRYDKRHLVPFGEFIPFRHSLPWLYRWFLSLSPYDYDYNLTAGTDATVFPITAEGTLWRFGVLICYEDTHSGIARQTVVDANGQKRVDWLMNLSNDGWYVYYRNGRVIPSAELSQRTAISVFRCVENRIAIVRSVNTGISCLIEPTGQIRDGFVSGTLPSAAMARQAVEGWFADVVPIDSRVSIFSRTGRWLDGVATVGVVLFSLWAVAEKLKWLKQSKV